MAVSLLLTGFDIPPVQLPELTPQLIEQFRITTFEVGTLGNWRINNYMIHESDAMVLTRTALGESPESLEDRIYVMWLIRIRAELGYKNGRWTYSGAVDRWGMPSTIKMEALCVGGCQFEPWKAATYVLHPSKLSPTSNLRMMLHPTDEQLPIFLETYAHALAMVDQPISNAPEAMRGYDGFRSPVISDTHYRDWKPNGLLRTQFFEGGNVWVDHEKADNRYWDLLPGRQAQTPTPTPTFSPTSEPTATPTPTFTPEPEVRVVTSVPEPTEIYAIVESQERQVIRMTSEEVILFIGSLVLGTIGSPTLIDWLKKRLGLQGNGALVFSYVASFGIAAIALFASGELGMADFTLENLFAASATIIATAQFVYKILNPRPQT